MGLVPLLRLVLKVGHGPAKMHGLETSPMGHRQEVLHLRGHDDIAAARLVQITDELAREVTRVAQKSNPRASNVRGNLLQAMLHKMSCAGVAGGVTGTQRTMPELLTMSFKTENGMIGGTPLLPGIVTFAGALLFAIKRQHNRIQMKLQLAARCRRSKQFAAQPIMQAHHLSNRRRGHAFEKTAKSALIGKTLQSDQRKKQSVVLQNLGFIDALNSGNQDEEQSDDHVLRAIIEPTRSCLEDALEPTTQAQLVTKSLNQEQSAEMSQRIAFERKLQFLQAFSQVGRQ